MLKGLVIFCTVGWLLVCVACQTHAEPVLAIDAATTAPGRATTLELCLSGGEQASSGVNLRLLFDERFTVTGLAQSDLLTGDFILKFRNFDDARGHGAELIAYSGKRAFAGAEGVLLTLTFQVAAGTPPGAYPLTFARSALSDEAGNVSLAHTTVNGRIDVLPPPPTPTPAVAAAPTPSPLPTPAATVSPPPTPTVPPILTPGATPTDLPLHTPTPTSTPPPFSTATPAGIAQVTLAKMTAPRGATLVYVLTLAQAVKTYAGLNAIVRFPTGVSVTGVSKGAGVGDAFALDDERLNEQTAAVVLYSKTQTFTGNLDLAAFTLQIAADAPIGVSPVTFAVSVLSDPQGFTAAHATIDGTIEIVAEGSLTPTPAGTAISTETPPPAVTVTPPPTLTVTPTPTLTATPTPTPHQTPTPGATVTPPPAENPAQLVLANVTALRGQTLSYPVRLAQAPQLYAGANLTVRFPPGVTVAGVSKGTGLAAEFQLDSYRLNEQTAAAVLYSKTQTFTGDLNLVTFTLQIAADAPVGKAPVAFVTAALADLQGFAAAHAPLNGTIEIVAQGNFTPTPAVTPISTETPPPAVTVAPTPTPHQTPTPTLTVTPTPTPHQTPTPGATVTPPPAENPAQLVLANVTALRGQTLLYPARLAQAPQLYAGANLTVRFPPGVTVTSVSKGAGLAAEFVLDHYRLNEQAAAAVLYSKTQTFTGNLDLVTFTLQIAADAPVGNAPVAFVTAALADPQGFAAAHARVNGMLEIAAPETPLPTPALTVTPPPVQTATPPPIITATPPVITPTLTPTAQPTQTPAPNLTPTPPNLTLPQVAFATLTAARGQTVTYALRLAHGPQPYAGLDLKTSFPPGVNVVAVARGNILPGAFALDFHRRPDNTLTVVTYSKTGTFTGDGELLTFTLAIAADAPLGKYPVTFAAATLAAPDGFVTAHAAVPGLLEIVAAPAQTPTPIETATPTPVRTSTPPMSTATPSPNLTPPPALTPSVTPTVGPAATPPPGATATPAGVGPQIVFDAITAAQGETVTYLLRLAHGPQPYAGLDIRTLFPAGVSVVTVAKGAALTDAFVLDFHQLPANQLTAVIYSKTGTFTGDGDLLRFSLAIAADAPCGQYPVTIAAAATLATPDGSVAAHTAVNGIIEIVAAPPPTPTAPPYPVHLTVKNANPAFGVVRGDGIACGEICAQTYPRGTVVTLTAEANPGFVFVHWSNPECDLYSECRLTLAVDLTVTATFDMAGTPPNIVPEPSTLLLLMLGGFGLVMLLLGKRRRQK